ncbi:hypothetical protein NL676_036515 [Syzygium grande]|nr:hypothetical protein NL676_036515 [Syzygium grande]
MHVNIIGANRKKQISWIPILEKKRVLRILHVALRNSNIGVWGKARSGETRRQDNRPIVSSSIPAHFVTPREPLPCVGADVGVGAGALSVPARTLERLSFGEPMGVRRSIRDPRGKQTAAGKSHRQRAEGDPNENRCLALGGPNVSLLRGHGAYVSRADRRRRALDPTDFQS